MILGSRKLWKYSSFISAQRPRQSFWPVGLEPRTLCGFLDTRYKCLTSQTERSVSGWFGVCLALEIPLALVEDAVPADWYTHSVFLPKGFWEHRGSNTPLCFTESNSKLGSLSYYGGVVCRGGRPQHAGFHLHPNRAGSHAGLRGL